MNEQFFESSLNEDLIIANSLQLEAQLNLDLYKLRFANSIPRGELFIKSALGYFNLYESNKDLDLLSEGVGVLSCSGAWDLVIRELEIRKIRSSQLSKICREELMDLYYFLTPPLKRLISAIDKGSTYAVPLPLNGSVISESHKLYEIFPCSLTGNWLEFRIAKKQNDLQKALVHIDFLLKYNPREEYKIFKMDALLNSKKYNAFIPYIKKECNPSTHLLNLSAAISIRRLCKIIDDQTLMEYAIALFRLVNPQKIQNTKIRKLYKTAEEKFDEYKNADINVQIANESSEGYDFHEIEYLNTDRIKSKLLSGSYA